MSNWRRLREIFIGLLMVLCAIGLLVIEDTDLAVKLVGLFLGLFLSFIGLKMVLYYLTMARHMVGGMSSLFVGIIVLDFGLSTTAMLDSSNIFLLLYIVASYGVSGGLSIFQALGARSNKSPWILTFLHGLIGIVATILCVVFMQSPDLMLLVLSIGLISSAVIRVIDAFRPQAIVYIQ